MPTRKLKDRNIRNLTKVGGHSLSVTIPVEMAKRLKWKERQKVILSLKGGKIIIEDWPKQQ